MAGQCDYNVQREVHPICSVRKTLPNYSMAEKPSVRPSQKASHGDILGTKRGTIDPLASKRPKKIVEKQNL